MVKNKKLILLLLTIILITSLGVISATDIQENSTDTNTIQKTQTSTNLQENTKTITKAEKLENKKATNTEALDYETLYNTLTTSTSDEITVTLTSTTDTYTITKPVTLNEAINKLTINGNGKTINGGNKHNFLTIKHACNLILNNITITKCNSTDMYGGALYQENGNITINNSIFTENHVNTSLIYRFGGAIALNNTNLNVFNSTFQSNGILEEEIELPEYQDQMFGGAIYFNGKQHNISIIDSEFNENGLSTDNTYQRGGALFIDTAGTTTILNTKFSSNKAGEGAGIYYNGAEGSTFNMNDTVFDYNNYDVISNLGAGLCIENNGSISFNNVNFTNNIAYQGSGFYYIGSNGSHMELRKSNFESNGYKEGFDYNSHMGSVQIETNGYVLVEDCNFTSNYAEGWGAGAIEYTGGNNSILVLENNIFDSNGLITEKVESGAISLWTDGNVTINNCLLKKNKAESASAITYRNGNRNSKLTINNTVFDSNNYENEDNRCAAVDILAYCDVIITNSEFKSHKDNTSALRLRVLEGSIILENDTFDSNINTGELGALFIMSNVTTLIKNVTFTDNLGKNGSAMTYYGADNSTLILSDSLFDRNDEYTRYESNGGALYAMINGTVHITNTTFTDNNAENGGALYVYSFENGNLNITNSTFKENEAGYGGAVYIETEGNISITDTSFISNLGEEGSGLFYKNTNNGELIIRNSLFDSNGEVGYDCEVGGAIYFASTGNILIDDTDFTRNYAQYGSAIYFYADGNANISVNNSRFNGNGGNDDEPAQGGSIILIRGYCLVNNSEFINNSAVDGSAICLSDSSCLVNNSLFKNNLVNNGCINNYVGNLTVIYSKFIENTLYENEDESDGYGVAIYNGGGNVTINHTKFIGNNFGDNVYGENSGGAIYSDDGNLYIDNSEFISNKAAETGGAIETSGDELIITNSLFKDNKVIGQDANGGAISARHKRTVIDNCTFDSYTAKDDENSGGAIYAPDNHWYEYDYFNVTNCVFITNTPNTFTLSGNRIVLNNSDNYVPDFANVTVYVNEENGGVNTTLVRDPETGDVYIKDYIASKTNYAYKIIVTQTEESKYYGLNDFIENVYYIKLPHDYLLSVTADNVTLEDNTTIRGKLYYITEEGQEIALQNKDIEIWINNNYTYTTKTNEDGTYSYNHTVHTIGEHKVEVKFTGDAYLNEIANNTIFNVEKRNTTITVTAENTTINNQTNIHIELKDHEDKPVANANITVYINEKVINKETDENGKISITYNTTLASENHVFILYDGNYTYNPSHNITTFIVNKLNTTITIQATNCTIGDTITIKGKLSDQQQKAIANAALILFIDEEEIPLNTTSNGEFTYNYKTIHTKDNYIEVFYEGNDTYKDTYNHTTFNVDKINTTTTANITSQTVGNLSFNVNIKGDDNKKINNGTVIVTDEKGEIIAAHNIQDKTTLTIQDITSGTYTFNITYQGNDTYNPSTTTQTIKIKKEANITINVKNNTEGNVEIEVTLTDDKGETISDQTVEVTLPNGSKTNKTTDKNGKILIKDTTTPPGNTKITVKVPDTNEITGTNKTEQITIQPNYQKIIDELEKTSIITAIPENGTVDDNKVTVTLNNKMGTPISNAPITVKNSKGDIIGNASTDNKGIAVIPVKTNAGTENITVTYPGNAKYSPASTTVSITTSKNNVTVTVDPVYGIIGEDIILTAHITDIKGNPVSGGNLVFKLNGKTLRTDGRFDSNASAWKFQVKNGIVTIKINADLYLRNAKNLTASYSGSYKYNEAKSSTVTAQIKKRNAKITVTTSPKTQKQYNTIKFIAKLADTTPNTKNTTAMSTGTKVIFKVNGKTIKDNKGNNLQVKVVNNTATYKYKVPAGMGGVSKDGKVRDYNVEAVLVSDNYYPDTRDTATFNVERSPVTINIAKVSLNSKNVLNVQATIKDYKAKNVIGTNQVNIKINGKTYVNPNTGKTQNFQVTGGKISLKNIQLKDDITVKKVMIVTGARQAYLGARNETRNIIKS
ncbi:MAG: hypothetical protein IJI98_08490 [Methanosphaera sp.]|nr:hypothetical protein [Methanosphaera sp.]